MTVYAPQSSAPKNCSEFIAYDAVNDLYFIGRWHELGDWVDSSTGIPRTFDFWTPLPVYDQGVSKGPGDTGDGA